MPFVKRKVEPVWLCRTPVDKENQFDLDIVTNNALVGVLHQLASLVKQADDIFGDLSQECQTVIYRAERLQTKVTVLSAGVGKLDAKAVKVRKYHIFRETNN